MGSISFRPCSISNCCGFVVAFDMCDKHYRRQKKYGDVHVSFHAMSVEQRIEYYGWVENDSGCWEWCGPRSGQNYGRFNLEGSYRAAHRAAYETWVGPIPEGLVIRHKCDNPPCINPKHLVPGSVEDNVSDREERNRTSRGERHYMARLSDRDVMDIREEHARGVLTYTMLAEVYGVSTGHIAAVVRREKRKHVGCLARGPRPCYAAVRPVVLHVPLQPRLGRNTDGT